MAAGTGKRYRDQRVRKEAFLFSDATVVVPWPSHRDARTLACRQEHAHPGWPQDAARVVPVDRLDCIIKTKHCQSLGEAALLCLLDGIPNLYSTQQTRPSVVYWCLQETEP